MKCSYNFPQSDADFIYSELVSKCKANSTEWFKAAEKLNWYETSPTYNLGNCD